MHPEMIVDFCGFLRENGFRAGVVDTLSALEIGRALEYAGIPAVQHGLKAAFCTSREEWTAFDALFDRFLAGDHKAATSQPRNRQENAAAFLLLNGMGGSSSHAVAKEARNVSGASLYERLSRTDLSIVKREDQSALEQIARKIFERAASRLSRRLKIRGRRAALDFRRTIHRGVRHGGEFFELRYRARAQKKPRLVILVDISGSMNAYSLFLLRFAHALHNQFRQTHVFAFSTRLADITVEFRSREAKDALAKLSARPMGWSEGTRIGESLAQFNAQYGRQLLSRETLMIILSDGWDTGEPDHLASELRAIRARVKRLIWLNPLLGLDEYRPVTRGMAAALPYLDVFAPAHSLESLAHVERHLCSMNF